MKISETLSQFTGVQAFLAVAGMHAGVIYQAHEGEVKKLESFEVEIPKYSDHEGFYARGGKGGTYVTGSVREVKKSDIEKQFIKEMSGRIAKTLAPFMGNSLIEVYLFAPREILPMLSRALPVNVRKCIRDNLQGNYVHVPPPELIGMLKQKKTESIESLKQSLAKPEAKKLLKKKEK